MSRLAFRSRLKPFWKVQYLRQGAHLRTPDAVEKVTAWLQPAQGHGAAAFLPSHAHNAPSTHASSNRSEQDMGATGTGLSSVRQQRDDEFDMMAQARNCRLLSAQAAAGMQLEGPAHSVAAQHSDGPSRQVGTVNVFHACLCCRMLCSCSESNTGMLQNVHTAEEVEFCITSSGFKVARTRTQGVFCGCMQSCRHRHASYSRFFHP